MFTLPAGPDADVCRQADALVAGFSCDALSLKQFMFDGVPLQCRPLQIGHESILLENRSAAAIDEVA